MFHILSVDGSVYNVPLESLQKREELKRVVRPEPAGENAANPQTEAFRPPGRRKTVSATDGEAANQPGQRELSYAQKSYREAIHVDDERRELLHAFEIMSSPVLTLPPEMSVAEGWRTFQKNAIRHMPVLSAQGEIMGIVSERDLLTQLIVRGETIESATNRQIADVMTRKVISASRETDIRRIARAMFENHIGTMPIVGPDRDLRGIITRSDILFALIHYGPLKLWA